MDAKALFAMLAAACIVWHIVTNARIVNYLQKKGVKINWFLIRMLLPYYAGRYQKLTRAETGQTGPLFIQWLASINAVLVFAILAILFKLGVLR